MDFGEAIKKVKAGYKIQREGWNDKQQYVEHAAIGNKALAFVGTSGVQLGWLASQADMLAEDWKCIE